MSKYGNYFSQYVISTKGDTLYKQISISEMHGCIAKTVKEFREIRDPSGEFKTINFIRPKKYIIRKYDKNGKLVSKEKTDYLDPFIWGTEQFKVY